MVLKYNQINFNLKVKIVEESLFLDNISCFEVWTTRAYAGAGSTHTVGAGDGGVNGGEGLAEVGVRGGATIEMGEPLTRGRLFADCLTFPLQEIRI